MNPGRGVAMEGEFILWKRLSCLVCLRCHDNQSIIQDEPEPSVLSLPDCICLCLFVSPRHHHQPPPAANGNDTKKFKGDVRTSGVPSRVVHVRKLPNDINEAEVIGLGLPFGKVTNLLMLKGKNQVRAYRISQLGGGAEITFLTHRPHLETLTMALLSHPHKKGSDCSCWNSMKKSISG